MLSCAQGKTSVQTVSSHPLVGVGGSRTETGLLWPVFRARPKEVEWKSSQPLHPMFGLIGERRQVMPLSLSPTVCTGAEEEMDASACQGNLPTFSFWQPQSARGRLGTPKLYQEPGTGGSVSSLSVVVHTTQPDPPSPTPASLGCPLHLHSCPGPRPFPEALLAQVSERLASPPSLGLNTTSSRSFPSPHHLKKDTASQNFLASFCSIAILSAFLTMLIPKAQDFVICPGI